jgi:tRNA splicing endonuclease
MGTITKIETLHVVSYRYVTYNALSDLEWIHSTGFKVSHENTLCPGLALRKAL